MGGNDFGPLVIEHGNPIVETCRRTRNTPAINACHFEEIPQLPIGQLDKQIGQKTSARLADVWIGQGPIVRSAQIADAAVTIPPDRCPDPRIQVDTRRTVGMEELRAPEREPDVMEEQERMVALSNPAKSVCAQQSLLLRLGISVLHEDRQQF